MSRLTSLKASLLDGIFASVMFGFTVNYFIPFGLLFGMNEFAVGVLSAFPLLAGAAVQIFSDEITSFFRSRVKTIEIFVHLQALTLFALAAVVLLPVSARPAAIIMIIVAHYATGSVATPAWASLMSDTVDPSEYGKYFSWRGKVVGAVNLAAALAAGLFLFRAPDKVAAFAAVFAAAGVCRAASAYYIGKMDDVAPGAGIKRFSYVQFVRRYAESNFVKFVLFVSLINFATFLASPFFAVYMLDALGFRYSTYAVVTSAAALAGLLTLPAWGRLADKYGNAAVVKMTARFLPVLPVLWIFSSSPAYLAAINALAGILWAGFNLATVNFVFDAASPEVRTRCFGYFNFTNGFFIFAGGLAGGYLATRLPGAFGHPLLSLFVLSGIIRMLVSLFMSGYFKEVKNVPPPGGREMFYTMLGVKANMPLGEGAYYKNSDEA